MAKNRTPKTLLQFRQYIAESKKTIGEIQESIAELEGKPEEEIYWNDAATAHHVNEQLHGILDSINDQLKNHKSK
jgi:hypothetical protein